MDVTNEIKHDTLKKLQATAEAAHKKGGLQSFLKRIKKRFFQVYWQLIP